ncbi:MAG: hypothetical protein ACLT4C_06320 [Butyricicoccus sp.]
MKEELIRIEHGYFHMRAGSTSLMFPSHTVSVSVFMLMNTFLRYCISRYFQRENGATDGRAGDNALAQPV